MTRHLMTMTPKHRPVRTADRAVVRGAKVVRGPSVVGGVVAVAGAVGPVARAGLVRRGRMVLGVLGVVARVVAAVV